MDRNRLNSFARSRPAVVMNAPSITLEEWRDLLSLAHDGLTFRELNENGHVAEFTDHGYGLEHPVSCRIEARLLDCPVEVAIHSLDGCPFGGLGRYRVIIGESGVLEGWKLPALTRVDW